MIIDALSRFIDRLERTQPISGILRFMDIIVKCLNFLLDCLFRVIYRFEKSRLFVSMARSPLFLRDTTKTNIRFIDRFFDYLNDREYFLHSVLAMSGAIVIFYGFKSHGIFHHVFDDLLDSWELMCSRLFSIDPWSGDIGIFLLLLTIFIFLILPQIMFWSFRRKRWILLSLLTMAIVLDLGALFAHQKYCEWSYAQARKLKGKTLTQSELFAKCGYPLFYEERDGKRIASYTDNSHLDIRFILTDDGEAIYDHNIYEG